ncbi:SDR family oxidoreductase [Geotalea sp. SG265]|uniref:SDR family oxidoreductase n=1 Tax=Geotalea sp. SG265 TaxID=2922867 RepID=UPI001FAFC704|nr:SDR family oxidoreductase [Geotalea sp. SG265]
MEIKGTVVMVTGANGGIGQALVKAFIEQGAGKIYAAARDTSALASLVQLGQGRVVPVQLDILNGGQIARIAGECADVEILVNNAGINRGLWFLAPAGADAARDEMEVNFFGTLAMCRAFAPVMAHRGSGIIANVCSILGLVNMPANGTYCASKAAGHSLLQALRGELAPKNLRVVGIYPGPVDTRLTAGLEIPKASPEGVAQAIVEGLAAEAEDIFPDEMSRQAHAMMLQDPKLAEREFGKMVPA